MNLKDTSQTAKVTQTTHNSRMVLRQAELATRRHLRAVQKTTTRMLEMTGGDAGRVFTSQEQETFAALQRVRDTLLKLKYDLAR